MVGVWERGDATCRVSHYIPLLGGVIQRCCKGSRIGLDLEALGRKRWYTRHQKPTAEASLALAL